LAFAASPDPRVSELVDQRRELAARTLHEHTGASFVAEVAVTEANAAECMASWMTAGIDGVVAYNDDVAALVLGAALRAGIRIPDGLAIVGHDDTPIAGLLVPSLSSVRIDTAGIGRYLADLALSAAADAPPPVAGPETDAYLIERETS